MALAKKCMWLIVPLVVAGGMVEVFADIEPSGELARFVAANDAQCATRRRDRVTYGELSGGRSWTHYASANERFGELEDDYLCLLGQPSELTGGTAALDAEWSQLRLRWQPLLQSIRSGAHAADLSIGDCERAPCESVHLHGVFRSELHFLLMDGDALEAVRLSLDVLTYYTDLSIAYRTASWGLAMMRHVIHWWRPERVAHLDRRARDAFAKGLRIVIARLSAPRLLADCIVSDHVAMWVRTVEQDEYPWNRSWTAQERLRAWEFGFSPKKQFLSYLTSVVHLRDRWESASQLGEVREICTAACGLDVLDSCLRAERDRERRLADLRKLECRLR